MRLRLLPHWSLLDFLSLGSFVVVLALTIGSYVFPFQTRIDFSLNMQALRQALQFLPIYHNGFRALLFVYPPSIFPFLLPFLPFPLPVASSVWNFLSLISLLLSTMLLLQFFFPRLPNRYMFLFFAVVLLLPPMRQTFAYGQINHFVLLSIVLAFLFSKRSTKYSNLLAGLFLGVAISLKVFPIFLLIFFIAKKQWRIVVSTLAVWSCFILVGTLGNLRYLNDYVYFSHSLLLHRQFVLSDQSFPVFLVWHMPFLQKMQIGITNSVYVLFVVAGFSVWRKKKDPLADIVWYSELLALTVLFVMPFAWTHHLVFLLPMWLVVSYSFFSQKRLIWGFVVTAIVALLFFANTEDISALAAAYHFAFFSWVSFHALIGVVLLLGYKSAELFTPS